MCRAAAFLGPCLLAFATLAACEDGAPVPVLTEGVRVGFPPGGIADQITIEAVDRLPLRAAELIAPDGAATPAISIDVNARPSLEQGQSVANDPYRGFLGGQGSLASLTPREPVVGAALRGESELLTTISNAAIPIADPVAYRRDWPHYRIRVRFGTPPGEVRDAELEAPEPPAQ
ncbi:MAG: hypothetical protein JO267_05470 [Alphaproteobacteria bacterium]|nr:hypothetical protein [Alphaproteobacteria bacterium]